MSIGCEVEFIHVGTGNKNGDAIVARYGEPGAYKILIYDGGTLDSGEAIVEHVQKHYGTTDIDDVVNSHPDADHASGLRVVVEKLNVKRLHMHRPWTHSATILDYFKDGRITDQSLAERLKEKMGAAYELEQLALSKGIPITEPFQGMAVGGFVCLSPERNWYIHDLIPAFEKSPAAKADSILAAAYQTLAKAAASAADTISSLIEEAWHIETLKNDVETSAENESSVVLFGQFGEQGVLLTGDAGVQALGRVADYAEGRGFSLPSALTFVQIPHHGSRHNVSPQVLNRILGPILAAGSPQNKIAFASTSTECKTHPRKVVTNAFHRRGYACYQHSNRGWIRQNWGMPHRDANSITPIPFHSQVEA
jgi:beta-lactamase superfamily II metal-dependent hydrolase